MELLDLKVFHLSPIAMWIQDFSGVKQIFEQWKAEGIQNIKEYLLEDPERLQPCLATIRTIHINNSALRLYEAENLEEIIESFSKLHFEKISHFKVNFFYSLWNNEADYVIPAVNYTCKGKQIDIQLRANILPGYEDNWERLLLTTENISDYQDARRFSESIFTYSPTPLWIKDYSQIKFRFTALQKNGISDLKNI